MTRFFLHLLAWLGGPLLLVTLMAMDGACHAPAKPFAEELAKAGGCFDFWLNRYQTLIGAVVALCAALLTFLPLRRQLTEMQRQSALTTSKAMIERADQTSGQIADMRPIGARLVSYRDFVEGLSQMRSLPIPVTSALTEFTNELFVFQKEVDELQDRQTRYNYVHQSFEMLSVGLYNLARLFSNFAEAVANQGLNDRRLSDDEFQRIETWRTPALKEARAAISRYNQVVSALTVARRSYLQRSREFEGFALKGLSVPAEDADFH